MKNSIHHFKNPDANPVMLDRLPPSNLKFDHSTAAATPIIFGSSKNPPMICIPIGSPRVLPHGTYTDGTPARLIGTVFTSARYCTSRFTSSPIWKEGAVIGSALYLGRFTLAEAMGV